MGSLFFISYRSKSSVAIWDPWLKLLKFNMLCTNGIHNPKSSHKASWSASSTDGLHQLMDSHANDLISSHQLLAQEHTPQMPPLVLHIKNYSSRTLYVWEWYSSLLSLISLFWTYFSCYCSSSIAYIFFRLDLFYLIVSNLLWWVIAFIPAHGHSLDLRLLWDVAAASSIAAFLHLYLWRFFLPGPPFYSPLHHARLTTHSHRLTQSCLHCSRA
jgi:hypothetical protein